MQLTVHYKMLNTAFNPRNVRQDCMRKPNSNGWNRYLKITSGGLNGGDKYSQKTKGDSYIRLAEMKISAGIIKTMWEVLQKIKNVTTM